MPHNSNHGSRRQRGVKYQQVLLTMSAPLCCSVSAGELSEHQRKPAPSFAVVGLPGCGNRLPWHPSISGQSAVNHKAAKVSAASAWAAPLCASPVGFTAPKPPSLRYPGRVFLFGRWKRLVRMKILTTEKKRDIFTLQSVRTDWCTALAHRFMHKLVKQTPCQIIRARLCASSGI